MKATISSDQVLLNGYLQGDRAAISQLIERHTPRVRNYIRMMVKDQTLADDLLQETFIKVMQVIDNGRYTDSGKFLAWVLRIAHNKVIDHFRATKQNKMVNESSAGYDVLGTMHFAERTIEEDIISEQTADELRAMVDMLPQEQREVVRMRYYTGLSFKEIAEETGVSINTALGRMRYALINIRKMMNDKGLALS